MILLLNIYKILIRKSLENVLLLANNLKKNVICVNKFTSE